LNLFFLFAAIPMMWRSSWRWGYQGIKKMTIYQLERIEKLWKLHALPAVVNSSP